MSGYGNPYSGEGFADGLARGFGMVQDYWKSKAAQDEAEVNIASKKQEMGQSAQLFPGQLEKQKQENLYLGAQTEQAGATTAHLGAETQTENATRQSKIDKAAADVEQSKSYGAYLDSERRFKNTQNNQAIKEMQDADDVKRLMLYKGMLDQHKDDLANPQVVNSVHALDAYINKGIPVDPQTLSQAMPVYANTFLKKDLNNKTGQTVDHTAFDPAGNMIGSGSIRTGSRVANIHADGKGRFAIELETTVKDPSGRNRSFIEPWTDENDHVIHITKEDLAPHVEGVAGMTHAIDWVSNNARKMGVPVDKVDGPTAIKLVDSMLDATAAGYYKSGGYNVITGEKQGPPTDSKLELQFRKQLADSGKAAEEIAAKSSFGDPIVVKKSVEDAENRVISSYADRIDPARLQAIRDSLHGTSELAATPDAKSTPSKDGWGTLQVGQPPK